MSHPILDRAQTLTLDELRRLARVSRTRTAAGTFGFATKWNEAWEAAIGAADEVGRADEVVAAADDALFAVIEAVLSSAEAAGRDVEPVRTMAADVRAAPPDHDAIVRLHRAVDRTLGRRRWWTGSAIGDASQGVAGAAVAVSTWDLAGHDGRYTVAHRTRLVTPWHEVLPLPDALA